MSLQWGVPGNYLMGLCGTYLVISTFGHSYALCLTKDFNIKRLKMHEGYASVFDRGYQVTVEIGV